MKNKSGSEQEDRQAPPKIVEPPPDIAASIDRITGEDRDWFEAHPGASYRTRAAAPGEFWPVMDSASVLYVHVLQVRPGHRLRLPIIHMHLPESQRIQ